MYSTGHGADVEVEEEKEEDEEAEEAEAEVEKSRKKVTVFPYGAPASYLTSSFKELPSTYLGITLANMYPFVVSEKPVWNIKLKEHNYPITRLWPYSTTCRFVSFVRAFVQNRCEMFKNYEDVGGQYHSTGDSGESDENEQITETSDDEDEIFSQTSQTS